MRGEIEMFSAEKIQLREHEELIEEKKGDTWKTPEMVFRRQVSGKFYFTNQRIAFRTWGPFKETAAYDIEYKDIDFIQPYSINLIITTGIQITTKDGNTYKISVMKRNKCMEMISQYL